MAVIVYDSIPKLGSTSAQILAILVYDSDQKRAQNIYVSLIGQEEGIYVSLIGQEEGIPEF